VRASFLHDALISVALSVLYIALYYLSDWLVGNEALGGVASIFFLPAFVRLLGFLLVGYWVIPALFVAGLFCVDLGLGMESKVAVSAAIAIGGPLGVAIVSRLSGLKPSLSNLTPLRLLLLSAGCSLGNSIAYHFTLEVLGVAEHSSLGHLYVFLGDMIGTWLVIYCIKLATEFASTIYSRTH
jgi:hypothetical protein